MVMVIWVRGDDGSQLTADINEDIPAGTPLALQIANTLESVEYDDSDLSAQQNAGLNSTLNSAGFTRL